MTFGLFWPWFIVGIFRDIFSAKRSILTPTIAMPIAAIVASRLPLPDFVNTILKIHIYDWRLLSAIPIKLEIFYQHMASLMGNGYGFGILNLKMLDGITDAAARRTCIWNNFLFAFIYPYLTIGGMICGWIAKLFMEYQIFYVIMLIWMFVAFVIMLVTKFDNTSIVDEITTVISMRKAEIEAAERAEENGTHNYPRTLLEIMGDWLGLDFILEEPFIPFGFLKRVISLWVNILLLFYEPKGRYKPAKKAPKPRIGHRHRS